MSPTAPLEAPASPPFTFEATRAPRWWGWLAIGLFALVLPVGYLGDEGVAVLTAIGGVAALAFVLRRRLPPVGVAILAALTLWAVFSYGWSPLRALQAHPRSYKALEALTPLKLPLELIGNAAFVFGALRLASDQRRLALQWLAWTLTGVAVVLVVDAAVQGGVYDLFNRLFGRHDLSPDLARRDAARGCYTAVLFFWPAVLFTARRVNVGVSILIGLGVALSSVALGEDAPPAALLLSLLVWGAMRLNPRLGAWGCMAGAVIYFLAAPLVFLGRAPSTTPAFSTGLAKASWHARLDIWSFASHLIAHRPILGYGLDASRAFEPQIPMHPHDAALQLWLELGVPGALLAALFFGWLFYKIARVARTDPAWAAAACATGVIYLFIGAISFGVWQEWWIAAGAAALAICGMLQQNRREAAATQPAGPDALQAL